MASKTTVTLTLELANQLRALADHRKSTAAKTLADLIGDACKAAGITTDDAPCSVIYNLDEKETRIEAELFGEWRILMTQDNTLDFAASLEKVATRGGKIVDLDVEPTVSFSRQGSGVVIEQVAPARVPPFRKVMAPHVALSIAKELREAVEQA